MQKKFRLFLKSLVISLMCCALFVGVGYYYIDANLKPVQNETENVPYTQESPENAGVLFEIDNDYTFVYLDFEKEELYVSLFPEEQYNNEIYGYSVDFFVSGDYTLLRDIIDYIGGIEIETEDETFRYTGIQLVEIYNPVTNPDMKREILEEISKKISKNGVALDFFVNIIQNSKTDLTIPDCYFWNETLNILCQNLHIID